MSREKLTTQITTRAGRECYTPHRPRPQRSSRSPVLRHARNAGKRFVAPYFLSFFSFMLSPTPSGHRDTRKARQSMCKTVARRPNPSPHFPLTSKRIRLALTHATRQGSNRRQQRCTARGRWHKQRALPAQTIGRPYVDRQAQPDRGGSTDQAAAVPRVRRFDDAALRRRSRRSSTRRMRACMRRWATCIS